MKNKWRILKILITVILLGFLLSFSLKRFARKPLDNIAVNLKQSPVYFVDEKDIKEIVKKYNPTRKVGDVDIPALEKKLNALPAVDSANVYMNLNGSLNVDVKQRVPVFRLLKDGRDFYVDQKGVEFPISRNYSYPCMLITGNVGRTEYAKLAELVEKIDKDDFSKKYFVGISKDGGSYNLLTSNGNYKVEIGDLDNIDFKVRGFKTFIEKFLVYQDPQKYSKISVKYDNQIVTTLNPNFKANDSVISVSKKSVAAAPVILRQKALENAGASVAKLKTETKKTADRQKPKPKISPKKKEVAKPKTSAKKTSAKTKTTTKKPGKSTEKAKKDTKKKK